MSMKPNPDMRDKIDENAGTLDEGYAAWKRAKIDRGLEQSRDRAAMISVEQIWRDLKPERIVAGTSQNASMGR